MNRTLRHYRMLGRRDGTAALVANLLPRRVVYWAAIRLMAHATTGEHGSQVVPELYAMDALQRWSVK